MAAELQRRFAFRAVTPKYLFATGLAGLHEDRLLQHIVDWGRHKDQTRDRILVAIRRLEELAAGLDEFLAGQGPMVIDLRISRNVTSIPFRRLSLGQDV